MIDMMQEFGGLPTRNFQEVQFEGVDKINAGGHEGDQAQRPPQPDDQQGLLRLHHRLRAHRPYRRGPLHHRQPAGIPHASGGLEYETAYAFGPVVRGRRYRRPDLRRLHDERARHGPDLLRRHPGAAMELFEMGVITTEDTDGVELNFGNPRRSPSWRRRPASMRASARCSALGSKRMCEKYGHPELSMVVKGQEFAGYDSRALQGMGLGYATGNRGACHLKHDVFGRGHGGPDRQRQGQALQGQPRTSTPMLDSTGLCLFTTGAGMGPKAFQRADGRRLRRRVDRGAHARCRASGPGRWSACST